MQLAKLNNQLIIDTLLAYLAVNVAPGLLNSTLFKQNPMTGMSLKLVGAGAAFLGGSLFKKPNIANIGIAIALIDFIMPMVQNMLPAGTIPSSTPAVNTSNAAIADYINLNGLGEYVDNLRAATIDTYDTYAGLLERRYGG